MFLKKISYIVQEKGKAPGAQALPEHQHLYSTRVSLLSLFKNLYYAINAFASSTAVAASGE